MWIGLQTWRYKSKLEKHGLHFEIVATLGKMYNNVKNVPHLKNATNLEKCNPLGKMCHT